MAKGFVEEDLDGNGIERIIHHYLGDQGLPQEQPVMEDGSPMPAPEAGSYKAKIAELVARAAAGGKAQAGDEELANGAPVSKIELYHDEVQPPKRSLKDMAMLGLIPLATGVLGGFAGGNSGAMEGALAGLKSVGNEVDKQDKRYQTQVDDREKMRSRMLSARLTNDIAKKGGSGGGAMTKRYQRRSYMDPETGEVREALVDVVDGKQAGDLPGTPFSPSTYNGEVKAGSGTPKKAMPGSSSGGASNNAPTTPRQEPPKADAGTYDTSKGKTGMASGVPTTLPGAKSAPKVPFGKMTEDQMLQTIDDNDKEYSDNLDAAIASYQADADDESVREGESRDTAKERRKRADALVKELMGEKRDLMKDSRKRYNEIYASKSEDSRKRAFEEWKLKTKKPYDESMERLRQEGRLGLAIKRGVEARATKQTAGANSKTGAGMKGLSDKQLDKVAQWDQAIATAEGVLGKAKDEWIGPLDSKTTGIAAQLLKKDPAGLAAFQSEVQRMVNAYRVLTTGAGASMKELKMIEGSMPNATEPDAKTFRAKGQSYINNLKMMRETYLNTLSAGGKDTSSMSGKEPPNGKWSMGPQKGKWFKWDKAAGKYVYDKEKSEATK